MIVIIIGLAITILSTMGLVDHQDHNFHQIYKNQIKFIAEEAASAAAQFYDVEAYSNGYKIFNKAEGEKAAIYIIKNLMNLDNNFNPVGNNYWQDKINIEIQFWDDSNLDTLESTPLIYSSGNHHVIINQPTVIVKIDAGKPRYRILESFNVIEIGAHSWKDPSP